MAKSTALFVASTATVFLLLVAVVNAQCCADGTTPDCGTGSFETGPPPSCSNGATPACDNGNVGPNQPCMGGGGGGDSGSTASTDCSISSGNCATDGSSNWSSKSSDWAYDSSTGKFSGVLTTNLCSNNAYGICDKCTTQPTVRDHQADCIAQTFPAPAYDSTEAKAAPLRGRVGLSLEGVNIYGPMEAGFTAGQASCDEGSCAAGLDVPSCELQLEYQCPASSTSGVTYGMMLDTCGGHAMPYHYHKDLSCDYDSSNSGHSPLVGIALDGHGIYGLHETTGTPPTDLDACGGHTHMVPANVGQGVTATSVYHYHTQAGPPYTVGCFGPVADVDTCKGLYGTNCNSGYEIVWGSGSLYDSNNQRCYDDDCPCFDSTGSNTNHTAATCPASAATTVATALTSTIVAVTAATVAMLTAVASNAL